MAYLQHRSDEDVESDSFLRGGQRETLTEIDLHAPAQQAQSPWRLSYHLFAYMLVALVSFPLGRYSSPSYAKDENLPLSQSMLGYVHHKPVTFQPSPIYNDDPFGPDSLSSPWNNLTPIGKGHIRVANPLAFNISGGYPLNDDPSHPSAEEYTVSVFHQLHCLAAIKSKMARLQDWYSGENDKEYLQFALGEEYVRDEHIYHCFDYIRQAIMCAGDTALERARVVNGRVVRGVDGWGADHWCRDWDAIWKWAEENRTRDLKGVV